jgi:hypothetical protein
MPSAEPTKTFLMEGGSECEELKVTHSNPLQEAKFYTYSKKRPDENNPLKFYLLNFGNSVQPGDPVVLKALITGDGDVRVEQDNPDDNTTGFQGSAIFVLEPPYEFQTNLVWPCEFEVVDNTSIGYSDAGSTLRSRSQRPSYKPGYLSDAEIEAEPLFKSLYDGWLTQRADDFYYYNDYYPLPPEVYEIAGAKQRIIAELREYFSTRWNDWEEHYRVNVQFRSGSYWSGGRNSDGSPDYLDYSFNWAPEISASFFREDGIAIGGEGLDPVTLLAYEFISEPGLDIANINDWTEALRINFLGTPAPLTIECTEPCEEGCLPVYENVGARICVCRETPGKKFINEIDGYDYQPYDHNQSKPRLNDFNP